MLNSVADAGDTVVEATEQPHLEEDQRREQMRQGTRARDAWWERAVSVGTGGTTAWDHLHATRVTILQSGAATEHRGIRGNSSLTRPTAWRQCTAGMVALGAGGDAWGPGQSPDGWLWTSGPRRSGYKHETCFLAWGGHLNPLHLLSLLVPL